jgi:hypothetical protein
MDIGDRFRDSAEVSVQLCMQNLKVSANCESEQNSAMAPYV